MNPNAFNANPVMHGQTGFTLLELFIVLLLGALITTGLLRNQSIEADVGLAVTQAGRFQVLSAATGRYMADNYAGIKAIAANDAASKQLAGAKSAGQSSMIGSGIGAAGMIGAAGLIVF